MGKKVDYEKLVGQANLLFDKIHRLATEFSKFELSKPVQTEIKEIIKLSDRRGPWLGSPKEHYAELMDDASQIEDDLGEIEMITGDLIRQVNELPADAQKAWFMQMGMEDISKEFEGLGEDLQEVLKHMFYLVLDLLKTSEQYYSLERERYLDFEEETEE